MSAEHAVSLEQLQKIHEIGKMVEARQQQVREYSHCQVRSSWAAESMERPVLQSGQARWLCQRDNGHTREQHRDMEVCSSLELSQIQHPGCTAHAQDHPKLWVTAVHPR